MSILIKGMEMPTGKNGTLIFAIRSDGRVEDVMGCYIGKAVPVPPHGRLGDLDAAVEKLKKLREYHLDDSQSGVFIAAGISQCIEVLTGKDAPIIIPAEEGE